MTGLPAPTFRTILLTFRTASSKALMERRWDLIHRGIRRIMRLIMEGAKALYPQNGIETEALSGNTYPQGANFGNAGRNGDTPGTN